MKVNVDHRVFRMLNPSLPDYQGSPRFVISQKQVTARFGLHLRQKKTAATDSHG
jgi:hypothetical protein